MKIKCINNKNYEKELTLNKTYSEIDTFHIYSDDILYFIINDNNIKKLYIRNMFVTISEYRNEKINKLLGE